MNVARETRRVRMSSSRLRVVAASDLHAPSRRVSIPSLVREVNRWSPDLFVLLGDIVTRRNRGPLVREFGPVRAPAGKLAVLGNWEYHRRLDPAMLKAEYRRAGVTLLVNETFRADGLPVAGLDDLLEGDPDFTLAGRAARGEHTVLVLSHCPAAFDLLPENIPPVLVLSGHTHGGQLAPFGRPLFTPRGSGPYVSGWYENRKGSLYVTRGVGTTLIPLRIGAPAELLVLDLVGGGTAGETPAAYEAGRLPVEPPAARTENRP
ncbi:MAG: metallophosphoesterase [Spirochaetota bacterium]